MPSNVGLIRAMPHIQRTLNIGGGAGWRIFIIGAVFAFFLAGLCQILLPRYWPGMPDALPIAVVAIILVATFFGILLPMMRRRTVERFDQLLPPTLTRLAADDTGVTIGDDLSHGHWDWRHIRGAIATPDGVALLMGYAGMFIPASAFRDANEQASFIDLVNRRSDLSSI